MKTNETNEPTLETKATSFFNASIPVHVKFKENFWKNGYIEKVSSDFFMLNEFKEGSIAVFYLEIIDITPYTKKEERE